MKKPRQPAGSLTHQLLAALRKRHPPGAWAFFEQVSNETGFGATRYADALAMSLWPSRGLELHGFEIKATRADWLRELAKPDKADIIASRCHRWWIVAWPGVVNGDELPAAWGLLEMDKAGRALRCPRVAPPLRPTELAWPFLAALLRRAAEAEAARWAEVDKRVEVEARARAATIAEEQAGRNSEDKERERLLRRIAEVEAFERASGIELRDWTDGEGLGRAVHALLALRRAGEQAGHQLRHQLKALEGLRDGLAALRGDLLALGILAHDESVANVASDG